VPLGQEMQHQSHKENAMNETKNHAEEKQAPQAKFDYRSNHVSS
jgi:hypothetical protein